MKHIMNNALKPGSIALGLGLMLTNLSYGQGQTALQGPPHNVIYWNGDSTNLQTLASSAYTDVIVNFVTPDPNCNVSGLGGDIASSVQTLHDNGKTVLVSFGGDGIPSANYQACNSNLYYLVQQIYTIVASNGFDGVDIDFEDNSAFEGNAGYDGVAFLSNLTLDLYSDLTQWHNIITHAPKSPYWSQNYSYTSPPYAQVFSITWPTIAWFNNQTYNDCIIDGTPSGTDCTAQEKIADYENIVNQLEVPPTKLVVGLPVTPCGTGTVKNPCTGDGYIPLYSQDGSNNYIGYLMSALAQAYPNRFGGVMGWNYSLDVSGDSDYWSFGIIGGLVNPGFIWVGQNGQTGLCLDSSNYNANNGNVYTDSCNGSSSQNWQFRVNTVVDAQTGLCLDSSDSGKVYTDTCNTGNYQNWEFFGNVIFDRRTKLCLDSYPNGQLYTNACNGSSSQNWYPAGLVLPALSRVSSDEVGRTVGPLNTLRLQP